MENSQQERQEEEEIALNDADMWLLSTKQPAVEQQDAAADYGPSWGEAHRLQQDDRRRIPSDHDDGYGAYVDRSRHQEARFSQYAGSQRPNTYWVDGSACLAAASADGWCATSADI